MRADAAATVARLSALTGQTPILVTGDNPRAAQRLAGEVGITDVRAKLLPQDKVTAVTEQEQAGRRTMVIDDGVNDAPALAAAHTGIAMGAPAPTSPWRPPTPSSSATSSPPSPP